MHKEKKTEYIYNVIDEWREQYFKLFLMVITKDYYLELSLLFTLSLYTKFKMS